MTSHNISQARPLRRLRRLRRLRQPLRRLRRLRQLRQLRQSTFGGKHLRSFWLSRPRARARHFLLGVSFASQGTELAGKKQKQSKKDKTKKVTNGGRKEGNKILSALKIRTPSRGSF